MKLAQNFSFMIIMLIRLSCCFCDYSNVKRMCFAAFFFIRFHSRVVLFGLHHSGLLQLKIVGLECCQKITISNNSTHPLPSLSVLYQWNCLTRSFIIGLFTFTACQSNTIIDVCLRVRLCERRDRE